MQPILQSHFLLNPQSPSLLSLQSKGKHPVTPVGAAVGLYSSPFQRDASRWDWEIKWFWFGFPHLSGLKKGLIANTAKPTDAEGGTSKANKNSPLACLWHGMGNSTAGQGDRAEHWSSEHCGWNRAHSSLLSPTHSTALSLPSLSLSIWI